MVKTNSLKRYKRALNDALIMQEMERQRKRDKLKNTIYGLLGVGVGVGVGGGALGYKYKDNISNWFKGLTGKKQEGPTAQQPSTAGNTVRSGISSDDYTVPPPLQ